MLVVVYLSDLLNMAVFICSTLLTILLFSFTISLQIFHVII